DRRPGCGCHLDQVEVRFLGQPERIVDAYDSHLLAGRADKPDFGNPDALVNAWFDADVTSLASPVSPPLRWQGRATGRLCPLRGLAATRKRPRMSRTRSPPSPCS